MATLGPVRLNGGWVSDADFWNDPGRGGALTYSCFQPWEGGAKSTDQFFTLVATLPSATQVLGAFYWQDPAQVGTVGTDIYIAMAPSKCYTAVPTGSSWTDRTNAVTLPTASYYTFGVLNGKVLLANSNAGTAINPFKITAYNGNIAVLGGSPPTGGIVKVVNNFAFLAQNFSAAGTLSRVYWSNVADPETWPAANFIDVNLNDGDIITGLSSIGTNLIIFKTNSMWSLSTLTTVASGTVTLGPLTLLSNKYGCMGQTAVDAMPDGTLVFMSNDGHIYRTDGTTFTDLSHACWPKSNIASPVTGQVGLSQSFFSPFFYDMVKVDSEGNRLFVVYKAFTGNKNPIYVLDFQTSGWGDWTNLNAGTDTALYMTTLPYVANSVHLFGAVKPRIVFGSLGGNIYIDYPGFASTSSCFDLTVALTPTLEYTISLLQNGQFFTPSWIMIPWRQPVSSAGGNLSVTIGFDGVYQGSTIANPLLGGGGRIDARIPFDLSATQAKRPASMQVKIQMTGTSTAVTVIEPFFISDEVAV